MKNKIDDWQLGNESKMTSIDRMLIHQEWLKIMHDEMRQRIQSKIKIEDKPIQGFVKD